MYLRKNDNDEEFIKGFDLFIDKQYDNIEKYEYDNDYYYDCKCNNECKKYIDKIPLENKVHIDLPSCSMIRFLINETKIEKLLVFKRDFITLCITDSKSDIIQYNAYAISDGRYTRIIILIKKCYLECPIITYYETTEDPYDIIEMLYISIMGRSRTPFQKGTQTIITSPKKPFIKKVNTKKNPRLDLEFKLDIDLDFTNICNNDSLKLGVPQELNDLEILIKNRQYISDASHEQLLQAIDYLTIF